MRVRSRAMTMPTDHDSHIPWRAVLIAVAVAAAASLVLHILGVLTSQSAGSDGRVDLAVSGAPADHPMPPPTEPLRFAIAPVISPGSSLRAYQPLVDLTGSRCGRPARFITRGSYAEVAELLRTRQCDVALVCTYVYVQGQTDYGLTAIAAPVVHGADSYHSAIIVPSASTVTGLLDLGNRRFASSDLLSTSGWVWPAQWLREQGRDPATFFGRHVVTGSHDRSVQAVLRGQADAAAVDSIVYADMAKADPDVIAGTRVVQRSPLFGMPPVVCHPQLEAGLRDRVRDILLRLHEDREGRAVLATVGFDRFVPPDDKRYDGVRATAAAWNAR